MTIAAAAIIRKTQKDASWATQRCKFVVLQDQNASNVLPFQKALGTIEKGSIVPVDICSPPADSLNSPSWATEQLVGVIKANDEPSATAVRVCVYVWGKERESREYTITH